MQRLMIMTFTDRGYELGTKISKNMNDGKSRETGVKRIASGTLYEETSEAWNAGYDLLFICAVQIAVRAVAGLINSKQSDRAVIVTDEEGRSVIPVLSGHIGGADRLARLIAQHTGGEAVITSASDIRQVPAFDEWASKEGFAILNKDRIKAVYDRILSEKKVNVLCIGYEGEIPFLGAERTDAGSLPESVDKPEDIPDVLIYAGKDAGEIRKLEDRFSDKSLIMAERYLIAGIGCKRGTSADRLTECIRDACEKNGYDLRLVGRIATIDLKSDEEGIKSICARNRWKLQVYTANELKKAQGEFTASGFVEKTVGVDNVCERAAVRAGGRPVVSKRTYDGVTVALAAAGAVSEKVGKKKIYIVGIGPGGGEGMTIEADRILKQVDVIVGYETYLELVRADYPGAKFISTPMKRERERCVLAYEAAEKNGTVAMICSGDPGVYGMASLMYEELEGREDEYELQVVSGVTAALSGAALLGAPIGHDFCVISLSDLLTPWDVIEKRLKAAAEADLVIVLYNPSSVKRADYPGRAADVLSEYMEPQRICGIVSLIGREGENSRLCRLDELKSAGVDMFSTVFIGSSKTVVIDGHMVTPRGYK